MGVSVREKDLATIFRDEINNQSLNQRAMANDINISPQLLSHILNGRRSIGVDRVVEIADYLQNPTTDFEVAASLFSTPRALSRNRRDDHPLSKMVGQDKEEMKRIELEKKYEIWDLLSISSRDIRKEEKHEIYLWLIRVCNEISSEIAVFNSVCNRYDFNSREIVKRSEAKERKD